MDVLLCWLHDGPSDIQLEDLDLHALAYADDLGWSPRADRPFKASWTRPRNS